MEIQAINKIEELVKNGMTVEVEDRVYTPANLKPVMYNPKPDTLTVHNLKGFCQFINNDIDNEIKGKPHLIVVNSPKSVEIVSAIDELEKKRTVLIEAETDPNLKEFPFGKFLTQEEFAITFRSLFVPKDGDDSAYVLEYASRLVGGTSIEGDDDGVTQKVTVKRGVSGALKETAMLKAIVKLSPYRTFREVEQPEGEFLFRVRVDSDDIPRVALFEADGGAWSITAMENIVKYIQGLVTDVPVIA